MSEISTEFKAPKGWQKYLYGGFLACSLTINIALYWDNRQCKNERVQDGKEVQEKLWQHAFDVGQQKKEEVIDVIQPQIDETNEAIQNTQHSIDSLSKKKIKK